MENLLEIMFLDLQFTCYILTKVIYPMHSQYVSEMSLSTVSCFSFEFFFPIFFFFSCFCFCKTQDLPLLFLLNLRSSSPAFAQTQDPLKPPACWSDSEKKRKFKKKKKICKKKSCVFARGGSLELWGRFLAGRCRELWIIEQERPSLLVIT